VAVLREAQGVYEKLGLELNVAHCVFVEGLALKSMLAVKMSWKKFKRAYKIFRKLEEDCNMQLCLDHLGAGAAGEDSESDEEDE